jgi:hypothetical protein
MGKIILTERQYRNLNQILIGKEVENNKGRLNEVVSEERKIELSGAAIKLSKLNKRVSSYTFSYPVAEDVSKFVTLMITPQNCEEAVLQFKSWANGPSQIANAFFNNFRLGNKFLHITVMGFKSNVDKIINHFKKIGYAGASAGFTNDNNGEKTYKLNPFSFGSCKTPAAVAPAAGATNINWGGTGTDPDRYWNGEKGLFEKLKPYGAKLDEDKNGPFMYWGNFIVYKNYSYNNGCTVIDYPTEEYKFTGYDGKYVGQTLDKIVLTPCIGKGAPIDMKTLLGKKTSGTEEKKVYDKPVVGGGGTGTGGTGGGTGTGGGGAPFGGQYADLV